MIERILTVGGFTLLSRISGFIRDIILAAVVGAGPVADAFFVALRLPNHFRAIFAEGAFNAAFVPAYARIRENGGATRAGLFADRIFTLLLASQIVLLAVALVFTPGVIDVLAPGFSRDPERFALAVELTRITFPYLLLITLVILSITWSLSRIAGGVVILALAGGYRLYEGERPAPIPLKKQLYEGVTYRRIVNYAPRLLIAHVLVIDRRIARPRLFVTPPDRLDGPPLLARTTSAFMLEYGVQIAVNGDGFFPWWSRSPADYYPHAGDPVSPNGFAASNGLIYSRGAGEPPEPTLYVSRRGEISFTRIPNRVQQAISGDRMVVLQGKPVQGLDAVTPNPRTAIGISKNGRWIYLVVIDGRQQKTITVVPAYSQQSVLDERPWADQEVVAGE